MGAVLWALFVELGIEPIVAALRSPRLLDFDRGDARTDLVDLLDALACDGLADPALVARAAQRFSFPWRPEEVLCPGIDSGS